MKRSRKKLFNAIEHCTFPLGYKPERDAGSDYVFDSGLAEMACEMGPRYFRHSRGALGGKPLELQQWQQEIIGTLWGWRHKRTGLRRYRSSYIEVGRGNGKSTFTAIIAGLLMYLDDEPGAEIIGAAGSRDQAREVFNVFKNSVATSGALNRISKIYQNSVTRIDHKTGLERAVYKVASAEAGTAHGGSAYGIIFDELHVQTTRDLWDVLESSKIKRDQPLTMAITTAGHDRGTICWEQHSYAKSVIDGSIKDATFLPVIYAADVNDDWTSPETWKKANPNLGVSIKLDDMRAACEKATSSPGYTNTFKRLHLNIWTDVASLALPMEDWDKCFPLDEAIDPIQWRKVAIDDLQNCTCYGSLDLAAVCDTVAFVLWFPEHRICLPWFWVPERAVQNRAKEPGNRGRYQQWVHDGFMETCPGTRIEYDPIFQHIQWASSMFDMRSIAFDKWNAEALRQRVDAAGVMCVEFAQNYSNYTDPFKELIKSVSEHSINHGHNPVLRWMASNLAADIDANENMKPNKRKSADKIDGMVALLMAMGESIRNSGPSEVASYYDREDACLEAC